MKRTEIAMIVLVASLTMIFTFTIAQSLLGNKIKRKVSVEQTQVISEDIVQPAKRTFNGDAINPTVEVCVESSTLDASASKDGDCSMTTPTPAAENSDTNSQTQPTSGDSNTSASQTGQSTSSDNTSNKTN